MCGEVFSEKYTPEQKAAPGLAKPHPLARPGRWSVIYGVGAVKHHERAYFDEDDGFATEDEAKAAKRRAVGDHSDWRIIPPSESFGDHDPSLLSRDQLERLARAILNNDQAGFEALCPELAAASAPKPKPKPKRTKAEVAEAIVKFLTDDSGAYGNDGDYVDVNCLDDDCTLSLDIADNNYVRLGNLILEYRAAV